MAVCCTSLDTPTEATLEVWQLSDAINFFLTHAVDVHVLRRAFANLTAVIQTSGVPIAEAAGQDRPSWLWAFNFINTDSVGLDHLRRTDALRLAIGASLRIFRVVTSNGSAILNVDLVCITKLLALSNIVLFVRLWTGTCLVG